MYLRGILVLMVYLAVAATGWAQVPAMQQRAWAGDSVAMITLSEAFRFGKGVEKNEDSAKVYIKKASDKGLTEAQFLYGTELMTDVFTTATYAKGIALLKKAADKGNMDAQYRLAEIHLSKGRGNVSDTYYDVKKAYFYGEMAAKQGLPEALMFCAEARLKASGVAKNDSIAVAYFRRAAEEKNYVPALIRMGNMYWEGKVTGKPEPFLALEWFERALAQKHANLDQRGKADEGIYLIDQFFKQIQNTFLDANPAMPMGMFDYRLR
jgi:uncharacterized protein